ncbi:unnamed protein product [Choristocarpus tenellus]
MMPGSALKRLENIQTSRQGTWGRLPKIIGNASLVRELVFTGRRFCAMEAKDCGMLSQVLSSRDVLIEAALELAREISTKSPVAVQGSKVNLNYARDNAVGEALNFQTLWSSAMLQTYDIPIALEVAKAKAEQKPSDFPEL